jgi:hypothetical protein
MFAYCCFVASFVSCSAFLLFLYACIVGGSGGFIIVLVTQSTHPKTDLGCIMLHHGATCGLPSIPIRRGLSRAGIGLSTPLALAVGTGCHREVGSAPV